MKPKVTFIPGFRLIFWTGMVVVPCACLAALAPTYAGAALGFIVGWTALACGDILAARSALTPIQILAPALLRLSVGRENQIRLQVVFADKKSPGWLRLGLSLPPQIHADACEHRLEIAAATATVSVLWPVRALKQGRYTLKRCYLETGSRLGFWNLRASRSLHMEVRAYPNLWNERQHLAALFLNRGVGVHRQRQVGKGREFDQLREYIPGDSYEDIHWKATAKRRQPITRVYQIERTQQIYVVIDASRLSTRPADRSDQKQGTASDGMFLETIFDRFITAALVMGMAAQRQGDLFGLIVFDDNMRVFRQARSGAFHFNTCRDALYTLASRRVSPDFSELFAFIGARIRRRSLLIFLTSLDDPVLAESFTRHIDIISRRHLVLVQMIQPILAAPLFSKPAIQSVDDLYQHLGGHFLWASLQETVRVLKRRGVRMGFADNAQLCPSLVSRYLAVKQRQLL